MRVPLSRERGREYCAFQKLRRPKRNRDAERCFAFRLNETSLRVECETERNRRGIRPSARESPFVSQKWKRKIVEGRWVIRWKARDSLDNHGSGGGVAIRRYVCRGSVRLLTILVLRCYVVTDGTNNRRLYVIFVRERKYEIFSSSF